ncbi:CapA family protein [Candidatus Saccharibacteria bacterium]|nr:CapA family protein [Candidatus Saccharibacteria bacterium]
MKKVICSLCLFAVIGAGVFFGIQFFTKTGIFKIPGVVYYDESLSEEETNKLKTIFTEDVVLDKDVTISSYNTLNRPEIKENEYIYNIYVPVVDFYSSETNVAVENVDELFNNCAECSYKLIDIDDLDFKQKLLSINDKYYLDDFDTGAVFHVVKFESEKFDEEIKPLVNEAFAREYPTKDKVLTFAQTGVTAMSRGMNQKLYEIGDATFFAANIKDYLSSFDITHTSNESSFSDFANARNICSDGRFINTLTAIGLDVVELTGNHNVDCGIDSANNTIDIYNNNGIKIVGGGKNATEAAVPLNLSEKNTNITMLAYNQSTGGATTGDYPGANQYYEENASSEIFAAKARGDFVIVDIQYYECSFYVSDEEETFCDFAGSSAGDQIGFFRHLIDLGADVVVGTSAHQPQTYELYGNGAIYYGLGNLFFDQVWWPGTTRSLILSHYFYNGKLLQTQVVPTVYDANMQTRVMENPGWFLERLKSERP